MDPRKYNFVRQWIVLIVVALFLIGAIAMQAFAQQVRCAPTVDALRILGERGQESIDFRVVDHPTVEGEKIRIDLWVETGGKNWTLTGTGSDRFTCLWAYGDNYGGQMLDDILGPVKPESVAL